MSAAVEAVLFDLGGVIATSPVAKLTEYERRAGLPERFITLVNTTNPDDNAWARFERGELTQQEFAIAFEAEAEALGATLDGDEILACLDIELRPEMVAAVTACAERLSTALVTNNFKTGDQGQSVTTALDEIADIFDVVVESAKVGMRKPDPRIFELTCDALDVEPAACVFLDDLGTNLKPARAMGMTTIKVVDPAQALADLEAAVGFPVRPRS